MSGQTIEAENHPNILDQLGFYSFTVEASVLKARLVLIN
jgi:hypothetical protein